MDQHPSAASRDRLPLTHKLVFALGDHTVNLVLSAVSFFYLFFLTEYAGLRPALAGVVVWIARAVDAVTDPAMGRISDLTRWRVGRRRGYFLIGALPFGFCFALMWSASPFESQAGRFAYYSSIYALVSIWMTCLSVPYLALLPEMAEDYDERTSLNTFRSAAAVIGTLAAVAMKSLADSLGGDAHAWQQAGITVGLWLALPWYGVYKVSFERPSYRRQSQIGFSAGARLLLKHHSYRTLCSFFILARIAVDLIGAMFLLYFTYWIGRPADFAPTLFLFLSVVVLSLPFWLRIAARSDKRTIFVVGAGWWALASLFIFYAQPGWPRWTMFVIAGLAAIGYAVADLMPWAMLGEVIDEDEVVTGDRREGVYVGFFMFLRKLGGATGVLVLGVVLDLCGYVGGVPREQQSALALDTIRFLTSVVPAVFLVLAIGVALGYPLTRAAHQKVLDQLRRRRRAV